MAPSRGNNVRLKPPPSSVWINRIDVALGRVLAARLQRWLIWMMIGLMGLYAFGDVSPWTPFNHTTGTTKTQLTFVDLDSSLQLQSSLQPILILTPVKNSTPYLRLYFENLSKLNYPKHLISIAFLVSDSTDDTFDLLTQYAQILSTYGIGVDRERFKSIKVIKKDFHFDLDTTKRHLYESQPVRRSALAKARNYLLTIAMDEVSDWILWLDVDVVSYDSNILRDLMSLDKDVMVPNCLWHKHDWEFWGFDRNAWQETEESLNLKSTLDPSYLLVEGYEEFPTFRHHLVDMPSHFGKAYVPLDGVGATFLLVKSKVHREGVIFPTWVVENSIETEGFAKLAKKMGFEVVGVPGL